VGEQPPPPVNALSGWRARALRLVAQRYASQHAEATQRICEAVSAAGISLRFLAFARIDAFSNEFVPRPPPFDMLLAGFFFAGVV
jgi:hypothetical protein